MTYIELLQELKTLGMPVTYGSFKKSVKPPFIVLQFAYSDDLIADNQNYQDIGNYQVELYTAIKHPPTEQLVQNKLKELRLPYGKVEAYIDSEELYQIIYEIKLIGG